MRQIILNYTGSSKTLNLSKGYWKFELWGAGSGYSSFNNTEDPGSPEPGLGAYVSGVLHIKENTVFHANVGGQGTNNTVNTTNSKPYGAPGKGGFNGGIDGAEDTWNWDCASGGSGGATDIRIDDNGLYSRIIVAGGGGSPGCNMGHGGYGGSGGTIEGIDGGKGEGTPGRGGHYNESNLLFGDGQKGEPGNGACGSGGGGYFGGYGGIIVQYGDDGNITTDGHGGGGGGGSSYVSGCTGCITLRSDNTTADNYYSSDYVFNDIVMIAGNETNIPTFNDVDYIPHVNHGLIVITRLYTNTQQHPIVFKMIHYIFSCCIFIGSGK